MMKKENYNVNNPVELQDSQFDENSNGQTGDRATSFFGVRTLLDLFSVLCRCFCPPAQGL